MKKLGLLVASLFIVAGCAAGIEDGKGSYSGNGRIVSIMVNEEGNSEVGVQTQDQGLQTSHQYCLSLYFQ